MVISGSGFKIVTTGDEKVKNIQEMNRNIFSVGNQEGQNFALPDPCLMSLFLKSSFLPSEFSIP